MPLKNETPTDLVHLKAPVETARAEALAYFVALEKFVIVSHEQKAAVASALADASAKMKSLEAQEKTLTSPLAARLDSARDIYRPGKVAYKSLIDLLKRILHDYEVTTALQIADATERAATLAQAGDVAGAHLALVGSPPPTQDAPGAKVKHPWTFEVINAGLLPAEYLLPNYKAIEAHMRAELAKTPHETPVLPGVKFYRELQITAAPKRLNE